MRHSRHSSLRCAVPLAIALAAAALPAGAGDDDFAASFAGAIEAAHGREAWQSHSAFAAEITVSFGGQEMLAGTMMTDTAVGKVRIELKNGDVLVFDGSDAWISPASSQFQGARFHLLTWPYFVAAPMKLRDPGTHLRDLGPLPLADGEVPAAKLTFDSGVGDTPDDWYVVYRDPETDRVPAMGYIVTFGKELAEAEKEPHAITYGDFADVDGVAIPTHWRFWLWNQEEGLVGEPIGEARLSRPRFVEPEPGAFARPADARAEPLPGS